LDRSRRGWSRRDFYFGSGEYVGGMISNPLYIRAVWFLSVGFYLAVIGSLLLLVLSIRPLAESPKAFVFSSIGAIKELFFSTIAWIKRRLPAVFLLLSLFLPWWAKIELARSAPFRLGNILFTKSYVTGRSDYCFPWNAGRVSFTYRANREFEISLGARFSEIPSLFLVSALIFVGCLCGFSSRRKIRSVGGLLSLLGIISFFPLVFHASGMASYLENPYFGIADSDRKHATYIWFLSTGFYLAVAGSIMLLLPTIRPLVERLRKRL